MLLVAACLENPSDCVMRTQLSDDASSHTDDSGRVFVCVLGKVQFLLCVIHCFLCLPVSVILWVASVSCSWSDAVCLPVRCVMRCLFFPCCRSRVQTEEGYDYASCGVWFSVTPVSADRHGA